MVMPVENLETAALKLDVTARAHLAGKFLLSLDALSDEENVHLWVAEAEHRLGELRTGRAKESPLSQVLRRARVALT